MDILRFNGLHKGFMTLQTCMSKVFLAGELLSECCGTISFTLAGHPLLAVGLCNLPAATGRILHHWYCMQALIRDWLSIFVGPWSYNWHWVQLTMIQCKSLLSIILQKIGVTNINHLVFKLPHNIHYVLFVSISNVDPCLLPSSSLLSTSSSLMTSSLTPSSPLKSLPHVH